MLPGGSSVICVTEDTFPGVGSVLYCTDPAQHLITAGEDLDYIDDDLLEERGEERREERRPQR